MTMMMMKRFSSHLLLPPVTWPRIEEYKTERYCLYSPGCGSHSTHNIVLLIVLRQNRIFVWKGIFMTDSALFFTAECWVIRHVRKFATSDYSLRHVSASVRMEELGSHWTDFHEIWYFSTLRNFNFHSILTRITGTLHEDRYTFMIISHWIRLRMRNVSDKICRENQNTHFIFNNFFPKIVPFMR